MNSLKFCLVAVFGCALSLSGYSQSASPISADSSIVAAKVFADRALVTRSAQVKLPKGEQNVVFDFLPPNLDKNSVQVIGTGKAALKDIRVEDAVQAASPDNQVQGLLERLKALEEAIREKTDAVNESQKEKDFLADVGRKVTAPEQNSGPAVDVQKWEQMSEYFRTNLVRIDKDLRSANGDLAALKEELDQVNKTLAQRGAATRTFTRVVLLLDSSEAGSADLQVSYVLPGASWSPSYVLRYSQDSRTMGVQYGAKIRQNTGEDWTGVRVTLSTARPEIGGEPPSLSPWYIDFSRPVEDNVDGLANSDVKQQAQRGAPASAPITTEKVETGKEIETPVAAVAQGLTSVVFALDGLHTIQSDNQDHGVTIAVQSFPATTQYSALPKLSPYAYLKVSLVNSSEYPFLPGETQVFLDGSFIASARMDLVAPGESFSTSLGVDEGLKVDYKLLNRETKKEGLLGDKRTVTYSSLIKLKNTKNVAVDLTVWDQLPISQNKDIVVSLADAKVASTDQPKKNELSYLEWHRNLKPGEEKTIPLTFSVTAPGNQPLDGLP